MRDVVVASYETDTIDADVLVLCSYSADSEFGFVFASDDFAIPAGDSLRRHLSMVKFSGDVGEVVLVPAVDFDTASSLAIVGLGNPSTNGWRGADLERLRRAAGETARTVIETMAKHVVIVSPASSAHAVSAMVEGFALGSYRIPTMAASSELADGVQLTVLVNQVALAEAGHAAARARLVGSVVNGARDLVNAPPSALTPELFVHHAERTAALPLVSIEVQHVDELVAAGYGGIVGVGRGSVNPPVLASIFRAGDGVT